MHTKLLTAFALVRRPSGQRGVPEALLVALMFAMGIGSFLFHTYATVWASYADTGPIGVFMLSYLVYALRRLLGLGWVLVGLGLAAFVAALKFAGGVQCQLALVSETAASRGPCLNGTAGYVPAFLAMVAITAALAMARHPAWRYLAGASAIFLVSMTFRTLDGELCDQTRLYGYPLGTHFLWHLLNATTLFILAMAAIRHGRR